MNQFGLFAGRLTTVGLTVSNPLSADELACAVRSRTDPSRLAQLARLQRSLASAAGHRDIEWGPMALTATVRAVQVDGSWHRSWRAALLPLLAVPADWLGPLLTGTPTTTRSVTVVFRPVPTMVAAKQVSRQLTSLQADHDTKTAGQFRITSREHHKAHAMEQREDELGRGFAQFEIALVVTATAPTPTALEVAADQIEDAAGLVDLRPLDFDQTAGFVASLPLGRIAR